MEMTAPLVEKLSEFLGPQMEPALRLVLSVLLGYPCALVYRWLLFQRPSRLVHLYHVATGLALAAFNFGAQLHHSAVCVLVQFLILRLMGRTVTAVLSSFVFQFSYLLAGYYFTATEEYDITWTTPLCVLTLKLVGLALDYYDGGKEAERRSAEQREAALEAVPSLLEMLGFSYFYGGFLVGPQFTMRSYQRLAAGELTDAPGRPPRSVLPALRRLALGALCMAAYVALSPHYPHGYFLTDEYRVRPFWYRCVFMLIWGKVMVYKYVSCWIVAEGSCILAGLGYNGRGEDGRPRWDACANMKMWQFETTPLFTGTIASFNVNTNAWVSRHVYKRLKFLGSKAASQMATMAFLGVWHGLYSGYFLCFSMEFVIVNVERQVRALVGDVPALAALATGPLYPLLYVVQQFFHWLFMGYPLVAFHLKTYDKWFRVYSSVYFCGHLFFLAAFVITLILRKVLVVPGSSKKD